MNDIPTPLDAYETAKPGEPTWTVQGGDPLGAPLLRLWAFLARVRAGAIHGDPEWINQLLAVAATSTAEHDQSEVKSLLIRATETEKVSWQMDEYIKGQAIEERPETKSLTELERLDLYDVRRRCAGLISNFLSELYQYRTELLKKEFLVEGDELDNMIIGSIAGLRSIKERVDFGRKL